MKTKHHSIIWSQFTHFLFSTGFLLICFISITSCNSNAQSISETALWNGFTQIVEVCKKDTCTKVMSPDKTLLTTRCSKNKPDTYNYHFNLGLLEINSTDLTSIILRDAKNRFIDSIKVDEDLALKNKGLVQAHFTFKSTVYGGAENLDGTSNISVHEGNLAFQTFHIVKLDSKLRARTLVYTDQNGLLFALLEPGQYVFITPETNQENIELGLTAERLSSMDSSWNISGEFTISGNSLTTLELNHSSVGYAP
jgi:hypothetical protein